MKEARFRILEIEEEFQELADKINKINEIVKEDSLNLMNTYIEEIYEKKRKELKPARPLNIYERTSFKDYELLIKNRLPFITRLFYKVNVHSTQITDNKILVEFTLNDKSERLYSLFTKKDF